MNPTLMQWQKVGGVKTKGQNPAFERIRIALLTFEKITILVEWSKLLTGVRKIMPLCKAAFNSENEFYCLQISNPLPENL